MTGDPAEVRPVVAARSFHDRPELTLRLPDVRRFWVDVLAGRYDAAAEVYEGQGDWEHRAHMLALARRIPEGSATVERWADRWPDHPLPLTLKGLHDLGRAWQVRFTVTGDQLSADQLDEFHRHLRSAENLLVMGAKADAESPIPWMGLLDTGLGLQISKQEYEYRMEQMAKRFPLYAGFVSYLRFVSARWFGSHEQMWDFADSVTEAASAGSPLHAIQADASIERLLFPDDPASPQRALVAEGRLDSLLRAADRSVLHSSFEPDGPAAIQALSSFVIAFERYGCRRLNHHLVPMLRRYWMAEYPARYFRPVFSPTVTWRALSGRYRLAALLPFRRRQIVAVRWTGEVP